MTPEKAIKALKRLALRYAAVFNGEDEDKEFMLRLLEGALIDAAKEVVKESQIVTGGVPDLVPKLGFCTCGKNEPHMYCAEPLDFTPCTPICGTCKPNETHVQITLKAGQVARCKIENRVVGLLSKVSPILPTEIRFLGVSEGYARFSNESTSDQIATFIVRGASDNPDQCPSYYPIQLGPRCMHTKRHEGNHFATDADAPNSTWSWE